MSVSRQPIVSAERSAEQRHAPSFRRTWTAARTPAACWKRPQAALLPASAPRSWCVARKEMLAARLKVTQARSKPQSATSE